jgi:hypothetical protein
MPTPALATHAVAHLLRFDSPLSPDEVDPQPGHDGALGMLLGTDSGLHEQLRVLAPAPARVWGALWLFDSEDAASAAFDAPERALPLIARASEAWHALLLPIKHWGESDWLGSDRIGPVFAPDRSAGAGASGADTHGADTRGADTEGPIVVTTAAGYDFDRFEMGRAQDFCQRIVELRERMPATEGLLLEHNISNLDGMREGMTFSLWRDAASMRAFAYGAGSPHRQQLDLHRQRPMFDRSSFTRYRVLRASGSWNGKDPLATAAGAQR